MQCPQNEKRSSGAVPLTRLLLAVRLLALIALILTAYLASVSLRHISVLGCGPASSCNELLHGPWSKWFGIPVSLMALGVYSAVLLGTLRGHFKSLDACLIPAALIAGGASAWFLLLQAAILQRFCPFCTVVDLCGLTIGGLVLFDSTMGPVDAEPADGCRARLLGSAWGSLRLAAGLALLVVASLILGQLLWHPRQYTVTPLSLTTSPPDRLVSDQEVDVFDGRFHVKMGQGSLLGNPNASNVLVMLFDYTCSACRQIHTPLAKVVQERAQEVAILCLPVPLEPDCNPAVKQRLSDHANACDYARISLAVWHRAPQRFPELEAWLFDARGLPSLEATRHYADTLLGTNQLGQGWPDPWVDAQIARNVQIFSTSVLLGKGSLPQFISGKKIGAGIFRGEADLRQLLKQLLNLP